VFFRFPIKQKFAFQIHRGVTSHIFPIYSIPSC